MSASDQPQLPEYQRERRGHDFYPPPSLLLPELYATDSVPAEDKVILAHYFVGVCDWWLCEYEAESGTGFGYTCLSDPRNAEWGYIPLAELEPIRLGPGGLLVVERDLHWKPVPFRRVRHSCGA